MDSHNEVQRLTTQQVCYHVLLAEKSWWAQSWQQVTERDPGVALTHLSKGIRTDGSDPPGFSASQCMSAFQRNETLIVWRHLYNFWHFEYKTWILEQRVRTVAFATRSPPSQPLHNSRKGNGIAHGLRQSQLNSKSRQQKVSDTKLHSIKSINSCKAIN